MVDKKADIRSKKFGLQSYSIVTKSQVVINLAFCAKIFYGDNCFVTVNVQLELVLSL